jgi:AmiR/NasT family two-component response regulator
MKVIEVLKLGKEMMKVLQESCIKMEDYRYIEMYEKYKDIVARGGKTSYAVAVLSERYGISERKVYYLLRKLSKDCTIGAVG